MSDITVPMRARSERAEDERILAALALRDSGMPVKHVAARIGFLSGAVLGFLLEDVLRELDESEGVRPPPPPSARRPATVCPVPGCGRALYRGNRSGVCRAHNHAVFFCQCPTCARAELAGRRRGQA